MQLSCVKRKREIVIKITWDVNIKKANCSLHAADVQINSISAKVTNTDKLVM